MAEADLKKSEGEIEFAKFNVSQCVIESPINGVVLQKYRELGDTINFGGEIQAGGGVTDIAQLADLSDMRSEVDINESDIAKVEMGTPATVIPDAYPDNPFPAQVVKIYPEADRQKGTVKVEVKILQPDLKIIKPEMSAKVTFHSIVAAGGSGADGAGAEESDRHGRRAPIQCGWCAARRFIKRRSSRPRVPGRHRGEAGTERRRDGDRGAGAGAERWAGSHPDRELGGKKWLRHLFWCMAPGMAHGAGQPLSISSRNWAIARMRLICPGMG